MPIVENILLVQGLLYWQVKTKSKIKILILTESSESVALLGPAGELEDLIIHKSGSILCFHGRFYYRTTLLLQKGDVHMMFSPTCCYYHYKLLIEL